MTNFGFSLYAENTLLDHALLKELGNGNSVRNF